MKNIRKNMRRTSWALFLLLIMTVAVCSGSTFAQNDDIAEVTVTVDGKSYVYRDEPLEAPDHTVYEQIERRNINAPLKIKIKTVDKCLSAGAKWREAMRYSFPLLPAFVEKIANDVNTDAVNSKIFFNPSNSPMFRITRSHNGKVIDETRLYQEIFLALSHESKVQITLKSSVVTPEISTEDNVKLTKKISSFSTDYGSSSEGRKHNIRLALSKINGKTIMPGEEFSFNKTVGARTEKNGFRVAKIIVAGEYTDGVGGGVCQASTTVYNAALTAGMKITAVRNHTITPSYVSPSLDAMVNAGSSDLKFVNPYNTPVFIKAEGGIDTATVTFYGAEMDCKIVAVSRVISRSEVPPDREIQDFDNKYVLPETPQGGRVRVSYGHAGVVSEAYLRYFTPGGRFIREEKIRTDKYGKVQGVVAVKP